MNIGICFSRPLKKGNPFSHIGPKEPVYRRLLDFCLREGWGVYALTRRTYLGQGVFKGAWQYHQGRFTLKKEPILIQLVYDRTGGVVFPSQNDEAMVFVNRRDFKLFCRDKWQAYQHLARFMPETHWVGKKVNLKKVLPKIKSDWVVLKPFNGLKGIGVFIGPKEKARKFVFERKYPDYIAQEFVESAGGIRGLINGRHDLRVVVVNQSVVWSHIRTPPPGKLTANVAQGGLIKEIEYKKVPSAVKRVVAEIAPLFYRKYDNPIFSLDFGIGEDGPKIYEINDQIGFPCDDMKSRDIFLKALVKNFKSKLFKKYGGKLP